MKNYDILNFWLFCLLPSFSIVPFVCGRDSLVDGYSSSGHYLFLGASLDVIDKSRYFDVVKANEKGVYLNGDRGVTHVRFDSPSVLDLKVMVSPFYVDVSGLEYVFYETKSELRETVERSKVDRFRTRLEMEAALSDRKLSPQEEELVEGLEEGVEVAAETDEFIKDGYFDVIGISGKLNPNRDISNAYGAALIGFDNGSNERSHLVRVFWIGEIKSGIPETFRCSLSIPESRYEDVSFELYLFGDNGKCMPNSLSRGLKMLSKSEMQRLREIRAQSKTK